MNIKPRRNRGAILTSGIGILVGVILLLLALFLIIYLLLALFRVPVRAFPKELYSQYIYEPSTAEKWSELEAPEGLQYRSVPLLVSTNLVTWETVMCRVDSAGGIHAPDGSVLQLIGSWDDEAQEWIALQPRVVVAGTNEVTVFRVP